MSPRWISLMPCAVLLAFSVAACTRTYSPPPDYRPVSEIEDDFRQKARFIVDGETTRSQIAGLWGVPTRSFSSGSLACYGFNLYDDVQIQRAESGWTKGTFSLVARPRFAIVGVDRLEDMDAQVVFIFDEKEHVSTHSLIAKKQIGTNYRFFLQDDSVEH